MSKMVMVQAIKRGTVTHATGTYHVDPDGFPEAQKRPVPRDVANALKDRGLVKILNSKVVFEDDDEDRVTVDERAAERAAENDLGITGLVDGGGTRDTTLGSGMAFAGGAAQGEGDDGEGDDKPAKPKRVRIRDRRKAKLAPAPAPTASPDADAAPVT